MSDHETLNPIIEAWVQNPQWRPGFVKHLVETANLKELKMFVDMQYIKQETGRIINEE
ncbi:MAG: hypothetical protein AB1423_14505 [Pseudomonadota bacterium]